MTTNAADRLLDALPAAVRDHTSSHDIAAYAVAGRLPSLVARPESIEEVASLVAAADAGGHAVVPWGSGRHMALGNVPLPYDLALDLRALNQVIEYVPADVTATVQAGVTLDELQKRLAIQHQRLSLDPPGSEPSTIGGILAANVSGPGRLSHGTARDLLIGIQVVTPRGALVKAGGRVVKNVAGYDMGKLHIGALGTLGVIVQATFKLHPRPELEHFVEASADLSELLDVFDRVRRAQLSLAAAVLSRPAAGAWRLHLKLEGSSAGMTRSLDDLKSIFSQVNLTLADSDEASWTNAIAAATPPYVNDETVVKLVADQKILVTLLHSLPEGCDIACYPASGVSWLRWPSQSVTVVQLIDLRSRCEASRFGALIIEAAPAIIAAEVDAWGSTRQDFELMRNLKHEMDPNGTLSPGRYLGGI